MKADEVERLKSLRLSREQQTKALEAYVDEIVKANSDNIEEIRKQTLGAMSSKQRLDFINKLKKSNDDFIKIYDAEINSIDEQLKNISPDSEEGKVLRDRKDKIDKEKQKASQTSQAAAAELAKAGPTAQKLLGAREDVGAKQVALEEARMKGDKKQVKIAEAQLENSKKQLKIAEDEFERGGPKTFKDGVAESFANVGKKLKGAIENAAENVTKALDKAVDDAMDTMTQYTSAINARLQGSDKSFQSALDMISTNLMLSNITTQKAVIQKLDELTQHGIVYNVEQRAFLQSITGEIVNKFDIANETLTRLIRLQQSDSTIARLGIEASLTKFLNSQFKDSSYLTGLRETVSSAIFEANSLLSREAASEFEFTVQKWLGSLYSVGVSSNLVNLLAQGIGYLGAGDITGLQSNTALFNLFAMASSRSQGKDLGTLLQDGLDASEANLLLKSAVEYLQEIAASSDTNVVRKVYGEIFGATVSDIQALTNLLPSELETITAQQRSYNQLQQEVRDQIADISSPFSGRLTLAEQMKNILENVQFTTGAAIANNPFTYILYKGISAIEGATGGTPLPDISLFGTGVSLHTTIEQLTKTGIAGFALLGKFLTSAGNLGAAYSGNILDAWGAEDILSRGSGLAGLIKGATKGVSTSAFVGTAATEDIKAGALTQATEESKSVQDITQEQFSDLKNIDDLYKAIVQDEEKGLKVVDVNITSWGEGKNRIEDSPLPTNLQQIQAQEAKLAALEVINNEENTFSRILAQLGDDDISLLQFITAYVKYANAGAIPVEDTSYFATKFNNAAGNFMSDYSFRL